MTLFAVVTLSVVFADSAATALFAVVTSLAMLADFTTTTFFASATSLAVFALFFPFAPPLKEAGSRLLKATLTPVNGNDPLNIKI